MRRGLTAGFGDLIGMETLEALRRLGFGVIRQDVQYKTPQQIAILSAELSESDLDPLWIVRDSEQLDALPDGSMVEWGNEPDLGDSYVEGYKRSLVQAYDRAGDRLRLSPGPISNLNERGLSYLRAIIDVVPGDMPVAFHRYPRWSGPQTPHKGYLSREHELVALKTITQSRELWMTETGYHTGTQRTGFWCWQKDHWTEPQVVEFSAWEQDFWQKHGVTLFCWYQLNDDPTIPNADYGIRGTDGAWKPVAYTFGG